MDLYKHIDRTAHRFAWRVFRWTGINLHQIHAVAQAVQNNWVRPFDRLPLKGAGAEIGVYRGIHAYNMLRRHPAITQLYLCDAYQPYGGDLVGEVKLLNEAKESCRELLKNKPVTHIYANSPTCAKNFADESLDFCYIDGSHEREPVARDVMAMWPKVKSGGIIGGHDCSVKFNEVVNGVLDTLFWLAPREAVGDLHVETPDWWIIKP